MTNRIPPPLSPAPEHFVTPAAYKNMRQIKQLAGISDHNTFKALLAEFKILPVSSRIPGIKGKYSPESVQKFLDLLQAKRSLTDQPSDNPQTSPNPSSRSKSISAMHHTITQLQHDNAALRKSLLSLEASFSQQLIDLESRITDNMYRELANNHNKDVNQL